MAPEQLLGTTSAAPLADLYAAALVMYEMLTVLIQFTSGYSVLARLKK